MYCTGVTSERRCMLNKPMFHLRRSFYVILVAPFKIWLLFIGCVKGTLTPDLEKFLEL